MRERYCAFCGVKGDEVIWHCYGCDYDVCINCAEKEEGVEEPFGGKYLCPECKSVMVPI